MNVQFDTGSNILWLPITGASGFHPLQSSTYTTTSNPGSIIVIKILYSMLMDPQ